MKKTSKSAIIPLIPFDKKSVSTFYNQIYDGIRNGILAGPIATWTTVALDP